ncbi:MAG: glutamate-1-semialdehyde-2,1-aminomutase [Omnitrophica bacterium RIFCSPLOWO2_12_FULL_50_11]|nr:MAG: glutamate-1-semialdehyde-2,1-aminomutase [Omnitrophica bacterium RIFCSPLOWO2_12_FULL_50_11]
MKSSSKLFQRAQLHIPGGVNSPVRAFRAVHSTPRFIAKGKGAHVWDVEGNRYLDFVMSWGPLILGHADPQVVQAVTRQVRNGTSYGAPTEGEIRLAELIKSAFPSIDKVRLVSSGTEAIMSAVRLARGVTRRKKIIKCDGCYHGHVDSLLIQAGSGLATFGVPNSGGVPEELAELTISIPYNDAQALEGVLKKYGGDAACFLLEPIPANMGVILPKLGYLKEIRSLTKRYGVLLIFDEVISGFRAALGGAQELYGVQADLTCLGKVLGGGLPIGAFGGRGEIMDHLAPKGKVYQAGTLSGNPLATAAGIATLTRLRNRGFYRLLESKSDRLYSLWGSAIRKDSLRVTLNRVGSCFTIFFTPQAVTDYASAQRSDVKRYGRFFRRLLASGIYPAPSQFEANFVSAAHQRDDLEKAGEVILKVLRTV